MQATRLSSGRVVANAKAAENASRLRAAFGLPRIQRRSLAKCSAQQLVSTLCQQVIHWFIETATFSYRAQRPTACIQRMRKAHWRSSDTRAGHTRTHERTACCTLQQRAKRAFTNYLCGWLVFASALL